MITSDYKRQAELIAVGNSRTYLVSRNESHKQNILFSESSITECENSALQMYGWARIQVAKEVMDMVSKTLLDAIDYAYLKTDGTYGDLNNLVADQVEFIKSMRKSINLDAQMFMENDEKNNDSRYQDMLYYQQKKMEEEGIRFKE